MYSGGYLKDGDVLKAVCTATDGDPMSKIEWKDSFGQPYNSTIVREELFHSLLFKNNCYCFY